jgi:hypothetical protein
MTDSPMRLSPVLGEGSLATELRRNWLVLVMMILGGSGVWFTLQSDFKHLQRAVDAQSNEMRELRSKVDLNKASGDQQQATIQRDVSEVRVAIGRVETSIQLLLRRSAGDQNGR